jgi:hypothetical protein
MFRSYVLTMSILFASGAICSVLSSGTLTLGGGLLMLSIGAGGLSAAAVSRADQKQGDKAASHRPERP